MADKCKSSREGRVCADGFVQLPSCHTPQVGCPTCGHVKDARIPYCVRDEMPAHLTAEDGSPPFYEGNKRAKE